MLSGAPEPKASEHVAHAPAVDIADKGEVCESGVDAGDALIVSQVVDTIVKNLISDAVSQALEQPNLDQSDQTESPNEFFESPLKRIEEPAPHVDPITQPNGTANGLSDASDDDSVLEQPHEGQRPEEHEEQPQEEQEEEEKEEEEQQQQDVQQQQQEVQEEQHEAVVAESETSAPPPPAGDSDDTAPPAQEPAPPQPEPSPPPAAQPRGLGLGLGLGSRPLPTRVPKLPAPPAPGPAAAPTPPSPPADTPAPAEPEPAAPAPPPKPKTAGNLVDLAPPPAPPPAPAPASRLHTLQLLNDQLRSQLLLLDSQLRLSRALSTIPPADLAAAKQLITLARAKHAGTGATAAPALADLELDVTQLRVQAEAEGLGELASTLAEFGDAGAVPYPQLLAEVVAGAGGLAGELAPRRGDADVGEVMEELERVVRKQAAAEQHVLDHACERGDLAQVFQPVVLHRKQRRGPLSTLAAAGRVLLAPVTLPLGLLARVAGLRRHRHTHHHAVVDSERLEFRLYCARVKAVALYRQRVLRELEGLAA